MKPRNPNDPDLEVYLRTPHNSERPPSELAALRRQFEEIARVAKEAERVRVVAEFEDRKRQEAADALFPLGRRSGSGVHVIYNADDDLRTREMVLRMKDEVDAAKERERKVRYTRIRDAVVTSALVAILVYVASMVTKLVALVH